MLEVLCYLFGVLSGAFCVVMYAISVRGRAQTIQSEAEKERLQAANEIARARAASDVAKAKMADLQTQGSYLESKQKELESLRQEFDRHVIAYDELNDENLMLKRDLQNVDVNLNKLAIDGSVREERQRGLDQKSTALAKRYLAETIKAVVASIGPNNYSACKQRLLDVVERCRDIGFPIAAEVETTLLADLKKEFELAVRAAFEREEQVRIKAQIREEERLKREIDRELKQLERERAAIQAALDQALAAAQGQHSAEVERLQARLAEAEAKSQRAISLAQQTKAGHVYVISNLGTFGRDVYKIGMTRRLDPKERVSELGSASVPFPFDVHMMVSCSNAPALKNALHRALSRHRVNRANPRKEFFRTELDAIVRIVRENHGEVSYVADPEALEYHQSLSMPEADAEFIQGVFESVHADEDGEQEA